MGKRKVSSWMRAPRACTLDLNRFNLGTAELDIEQVVAKAVECNANVFRIHAISAEGTAFFPSRVAPHAEGLGERDLVKIAQVACDTHEISLVIQIDALGIHKQHPLAPEGAIKLADGGHAEFGDPPVFSACLMGTYRDFLIRAIGEICSTYHPAGCLIRGLRVPHCVCVTCLSKFSHESEMDIPLSLEDLNEKATFFYLDWLDTETEKLMTEVNSQIKSYQPGCALLMDDFPPTHSSERICDGLWLSKPPPRQDAWQRGGMSHYASLFSGPVIREVSYSAEIDHHEHPAARPTVQIKSELAQNIAAGCFPDLTGFPLRDYRSLPGVADVFGIVKRSQGAFDYRANTRKTFLLLPQTRGLGHSARERTVQKVLHHLDSPSAAPSSELAMYSALMRVGMPVNLAITGHYIRQLSDNDVLCLPDVRFMDERTIQVIDSFVKAGGGLIATGRTSLFDENGKKRENFGLADVFGADYVETRGKESHASVFLSGRIPHPVTAPLPSGVALPGTNRYLACEKHQPSLVLGTFHETPSQGKGPAPAILAHSYGEGRVVYFPWQPELAFGTQSSRDIQLLLRESVEWVSQSNIPVEIESEGSVSVSLYQQPKRMVIHLVNLSADLSRPVDKIFTLRDVSLYIHFKKPTTISNPRALVSGLQFKKEATTKKMQLVIPELDEYEVIMIDFELDESQKEEDS
ncbi:MAG: beta-galactosidase trimerization domain-containing protein [Planctomycetota bacterium]|nr:beta-galactosidase trimerization domain-containing protein [Planctomycetota bacterium]